MKSRFAKLVNFLSGLNTIFTALTSQLGRHEVRAHIVHAHPEPRSYNGALTEEARRCLSDAGFTVTLNNLYQANFDPVERAAHYANRYDAKTFAALAEQRHASNTDSLSGEIKREISNLEQADLIVLQFPLWWHGPPAILKGWMDRVFVNGGLYTSRMRYDTGYFKGKSALVSVTTGAPRGAFGPGGRGGDFDVLLWPVQYSLHYMGFKVLRPFISYGVQGHGYSYEDQGSLRTRLENNLSEWRLRLLSWNDEEPIRFPSWKDWDSEGRAVK